MDYNPPCSSVHGISRQEYWNRLSFLTSSDLSNPGIESIPPALQADSFTTEPPGKPIHIHRKIITTAKLIN